MSAIVTPKHLVLSFLLVISFCAAHAQQVTEVITDFNTYWKSDTTVINPLLPTTSHNVLSFKYNGVRYSTGVNNAKLTDSVPGYSPADFRAFPISTVGGTILSGNSTYIALASNYDGIPSGYSNPLPSLKIRDVLIDGLHGLNIGTGVTNIPASALINFPVSAITAGAITDATPDILVSQIASPSANGDTLYFVNSSGVVVGNKIAINWLLYKQVGTYQLDLYTLPNNALCDTAHISGTSAFNTTRDMRLIAFRLSEFGITSTSALDITNFILKASGTSDPAFIAYNAGSFSIPAPVITTQPSSVVVCPNTSSSAVFTVAASGTGLNYQWKKNNVDLAGATSSTLTVTNVVAASAGSYTVLVSNTAGSVLSNIAFLNVSIAVQPSPSAVNIATGARATITVTADNATGYQWMKDGVNITNATAATFMTDPVTTVTPSNYSVQVLNAAGSGCASLVSNTVTVTGKTVLYSKPSVNLNLASSWGVNTDGSGSSPVDFTRSEHTFVQRNNTATGGDLVIAGTLDLGTAVTTITPGSTLEVNNVVRSGAGTFAGSATSNLTIKGTSNIAFQTGSNVLKNLRISAGTTTLLNSLSITGGANAGMVSLTGGTLNTGDFLTFKSDSLGTARLDKLTGGATVIGAASVERFIPAKKAWYLLSVPTNTNESIKQSWQEAATSNGSDPVAGFGTQISSNRSTWLADGFDLYSGSPSMKTYDAATNTFAGVTSTNNSIRNTNGYFIYIRGNRASSSFSSPVTPAVLRTKGPLYTYGQTPITVATSKFTTIGNPYPSALDMRTITRTGLKDFYYVWDPKLGGLYGAGAYQTFSNNGDDNYVVTPGGGSYGANGTVSNVIASGLAFMVQGNVSGGSLTFTEDAKYTSGQSARVASGIAQPALHVNLLGINNDNTTYMADGIKVDYSDDYNNEVNDDDALKSTNSSENLSIKNAGNLLIIERRKSISVNDTIFLNLANVKAQRYRFMFDATNFVMIGVAAYLEDNYLQSRTEINLEQPTEADFVVENIPGSYAADRFRLVFKTMSVLPVTFTSVKARRNNSQIKVEWRVASETSMKQYEVERSGDGRTFTRITTVAANAAPGEGGAYSVQDFAPLADVNYYRVKSISEDLKVGYTDVVKVTGDNMPGVTAVYPNPVVNQTVNVRFTNQPGGLYETQIINQGGQAVFTEKIIHAGGSGTYTFIVPAKLPAGLYQLRIVSENRRVTLVGLSF